MSHVTITAYLPDPVDGRQGIHQLRNRPEFRDLREGQAGLVLNTKRTIARIIDSQGGVYSMYAPDGYSYNLGMIQEMVELGMGVELKGNPAIKRDLDEPIDPKKIDRAKRKRARERKAREKANGKVRRR